MPPSPEAPARDPNRAHDPNGAQGDSRSEARGEFQGVASNGSGGEEEVPSAPFIKLAMRNMVRKGRQSLLHFGLTAVGLTAFLVLVAWLGRPQLAP
jgi:hypothetical protein